MKNKILKITFVSGVCILSVCFFLRKELRKTEIETQSNEIANEDEVIVQPKTFTTPKNDKIIIPSKEERIRMSSSAMIDLLEKLGYVPDDPNMSDYFYAEKTSWWGKRLNPEEFWKGRVVWYDDATVFEARRRGRGYPPMPYEDSSITNRPDIDKGGKGGVSLENPSPGFVSSEREKVFWINFRTSHPNPPNHIQRWLNERVDTWLNFKNQYENSIKTGNPSSSKKRTVDNCMEVDIRDAKMNWFPTECVTPEAFEWEHVMRKRAEYEKLFLFGKVDDERETKWFFDRVLVEYKLITEPLTDAQIDAANAWKVAYLNRLRNEKWDESYINAYLEAWNLTEEYVFGDKPKTLND